MSDAAEAIETASIEMPAIAAPTAGFVTGDLKQMDLWVREAGDRLPHHFGWMQPQLALHVPELQYEELPLALKVDVPEPRTVTVFETATSYESARPTCTPSLKRGRSASPSPATSKAWRRA